MITTNQFMFATACLFTVAMIGGCSTTSNVANNDEAATTDEAPVAAVAVSDVVAPPEMAEAAVTETTTTETAASDAAQSDTPKVTTTENDVVIIPLDAAPEEVAAATAKPVVAPNIPNIAKELTNHHNTQWHSRSLTYRLYLGGQLNAEYSQEKDALTISADSSDGNLACEYSTDHGGLASIDDTMVDACNTLANELQSYLSED